MTSASDIALDLARMYRVMRPGYRVSTEAASQIRRIGTAIIAALHGRGHAVAIGGRLDDASARALTEATVDALTGSGYERRAVLGLVEAALDRQGGLPLVTAGGREGVA